MKQRWQSRLRGGDESGSTGSREMLKALMKRLPNKPMAPFIHAVRPARRKTP
ncbi:hypothetical protein D3OALGA1CA_3136 [Olavius algarvensis associated proteobacterium Delta 3]|nr:hypothetical protein D3OALGA1CA_3136 [Olavius algarvensis associated proteobacterium Delta 3]CAB5159182.1 hypothetical protein D3OALGB2SA_5318 [Olavius algarvensis associated proteobacterium Delta 3]